MERLTLKQLVEIFGDCPEALRAVNSNIRRLIRLKKAVERAKFEYDYAFYDLATRTVLKVMTENRGASDL